MCAVAFSCREVSTASLFTLTWVARLDNLPIRFSSVFSLPPISCWAESKISEPSRLNWDQYCKTVFAVGDGPCQSTKTYRHRLDLVFLVSDSLPCSHPRKCLFWFTPKQIYSNLIVINCYSRHSGHSVWFVKMKYLVLFAWWTKLFLLGRKTPNYMSSNRTLRHCQLGTYVQQKSW